MLGEEPTTKEAIHENALEEKSFGVNELF